MLQKAGTGVKVRVSRLQSWTEFESFYSASQKDKNKNVRVLKMTAVSQQSEQTVAEAAVVF